MVDFFIRRPVFATVCALLIILAGAVCIPTLPIALYPTLAPPQVTVTSNYVGANSQTVESAVTIPLEQQINGVQGMRYISSTSSNDGTSSITTTFQTGYSLDIAAVDVQNRVSAATGRLPQAVNNTGITITKANTNFVFAAAFYLARQSLLRSVHQQLPRRLCEGCAQAHSRRGRCGHLRRAQICHAALARSGAPGCSRADRRRRDQCAGRAERRDSRRTGRASRRPTRSRVSDPSPRDRQALRAGGVRQHHRQEQPRRHCSVEGCGLRRSWARRLTPPI